MYNPRIAWPCVRRAEGIFGKNMKEIIKNIKEIHKETVCFFRVGTFYHCYNKDAYIISFLFNYKLKSLEKNYVECGFPLGAINKNIAKLENNKINYVIIDKRNNYEEEEKQDFGNLNNYNKFYMKANSYINYKNRIDNINSFLMNNIDMDNLKTILTEIENIIYERR